MKKGRFYWERCIFCGRFISYDEMSKEESFQGFETTPITALEPSEAPEYAHIECAKKYQAEIQETMVRR